MQAEGSSKGRQTKQSFFLENDSLSLDDSKALHLAGPVQ